MPYKKRRRYGRNRRSRRKYRGRKTGSAYRMAKLALRRSAPEWKYIDVLGSTSTPMSVIGAVETLTPAPSRGTGPNEMLGNKITLKRIQLRLIFNFDPNNTGNGSRFRMIVFGFKDSDAPTVAGILESSNIDSYHRIDTAGKYHIYFDKNFVVGKFGAHKTPYIWRRSIRLNKKMLYTGGGSQANNWRLCALFICEELANAPTYEINSRARFTDA